MLFSKATKEYVSFTAEACWLIYNVLDDKLHSHLSFTPPVIYAPDLK